MSYYLFLDDIRDPSWVHWMKLPARPDDQWVIVRDFDAFTATILENGLPTFVSFDHDLDQEGGVEISVCKTGMDCARWLVDYCLDNDLTLPDFSVHSYNPPGRANIEGLLEGFRKHQNADMPRRSLTP